MTEIYYETADEEVHRIDEVSQRLLVYVYLNGRVQPDEVIDAAEAETESAIHARIEDQLGRNAAGLVEIIESPQATLTENNRIHYVGLTDAGEQFIHQYRNDLSMPVDLAELAEKVAALRIEDNLIEGLRARLDSLEERLAEIEDAQ